MSEAPNTTESKPQEREHRPETIRPSIFDSGTLAFGNTRLTRANTPEWHRLRRSRITASGVYDLLGLTGVSYSQRAKAIAKYIGAFVGHDFPGIPESSYHTPAMVWGITQEPRVANNYIKHVNLIQRTISPNTSVKLKAYTDACFYDNMLLASPDVFIEACMTDTSTETDITVKSRCSVAEIKCPYSAFFTTKEAIPPKYAMQLYFQAMLADVGRAQLVVWNRNTPGDLLLFTMHRRNTRFEGMLYTLLEEIHDIAVQISSDLGFQRANDPANFTNERIVDTLKAVGETVAALHIVPKEIIDVFLRGLFDEATVVPQPIVNIDIGSLYGDV